MSDAEWAEALRLQGLKVVELNSTIGAEKTEA